MDIKAKLSEMGYELPPAAAPVAAYVPYVECGSQLFLSGALPFKDGELVATGAVGSASGPRLDQAQEAARGDHPSGLFGSHGRSTRQTVGDALGQPGQAANGQLLH